MYYHSKIKSCIRLSGFPGTYRFADLLYTNPFWYKILLLKYIKEEAWVKMEQNVLRMILEKRL